MRIVFMGTPEFAVPTLKLLERHHDVIGVYTQAPKPAGRGYTETLSPIHILANELNIPVYTPKTLRKAESQSEFASLEAEAVVVVAYGLILPKEVLELPKYGCINIHPSLLPKFRGAAPMQHTILSGDKETAMCIMQMDEGIDTGDILLMKKIFLDEEITYKELSNKMSNLGAEMAIEVLANINNIKPQKQTEVGASYAPKFSKEDGELKWHENSEFLARKVRALNPWPGTYFLANNEKIKILSAKSIATEHNLKPGTIIQDKEFKIACAEGIFQPLILQRPGKKAINASDFIRGNKIKL